MTIDNIESKIKSFSRLPNNWDGDNGVPPSEIVIKNALFVVDLVSTEIKNFYGAYPNPDGTISIEWWFDGGLVIVEIGEKSFDSDYQKNGSFLEDLPFNLYGIDMLTKQTNNG